MATLEDLSVIFCGEEIGEKIDAAKQYILHTYDEDFVEEKALKAIEDDYDNYILVLIHRFCLQAESFGGEYSSSLQILLESRRMWADRIFENQQVRRKKRTEILISVGLSICICLIIYMISYRMNLGLEAHPVAQTATVVVLLLDFYIFYRADSQLCIIDEKKRDDEEKYAAYYEELRNFDSESIFRKAQLRVKKKLVTKEIEKEFPKWLMAISLLLQSENVQVAIYKSYDDAPGILKPALKELIDNLRQSPDDIAPYLCFLKDYTLPEVHSAMKMLYSISEGCGGSFNNQITEILNRNQRMQNKSEELKNEDALAGLYGLFLAPQVTAGMKLIVDLILVMVIYLGRGGYLSI